MAFERVHAVWEYYDGPQTGVADYRGVPHYYAACDWMETDEETATVFGMAPIDSDTMALAKELDELYRTWNQAMRRGEVGADTHPGMPGQNARYAELWETLTSRTASVRESTLRAKGFFQASIANGELEVEWSDAT